MNLIVVDDLHVRYGSYEAVRGVSFSLAKGEILGIVGESGSGKSTIAKVLMGLHGEYTGSIAFNLQSSTSNPRSKIAMVFQDAVGSLNPRMTVRQTLREIIEFSSFRMIESGRRSIRTFEHSNIRTFEHSNIRTFEHSVTRLLDLVGLSSAVLDQYPREMSGGQCQRVSIARALACEPEVLIADEPVSALDVSVQARVLNLLRDLRRELGLSILLVAHDLAVVKNVSDRICVMEKGLFVDVGEAAEVFGHPTSAYTKRLLEAVPTGENWAKIGDLQI